MNSQLIKMEALLNGFAEGIALDDRGYVSEGSGENIFLVSGDVVLTPPLSSSILPGITRDSVIQICHELGITIKERTIQRAALYVADELFFSGTAAEITPIRSVDRITVGKGGRGEVTAAIQKAFFDITKGERKAPGDWLTYVNAKKGANPGNNGFTPATTEGTAADKEPALSYQTAARD
jgi:branched-chain amino acid aminotransferase